MTALAMGNFHQNLLVFITFSLTILFMIQLNSELTICEKSGNITFHSIYLQYIYVSHRQFIHTFDNVIMRLL